MMYVCHVVCVVGFTCYVYALHSYDGVCIGYEYRAFICYVCGMDIVSVSVLVCIYVCLCDCTSGCMYVGMYGMYIYMYVCVKAVDGNIVTVLYPIHTHTRHIPHTHVHPNTHTHIYT